MSIEKFNYIITRYLRDKEIIIKYVTDPVLLANAIEKLTYHRDKELKKYGYEYPYELGHEDKIFDYRYVMNKPKIDL